jgi:hypothetical protein
VRRIREQEEALKLKSKSGQVVNIKFSIGSLTIKYKKEWNVDN